MKKQNISLKKYTLYLSFKEKHMGKRNKVHIYNIILANHGKQIKTITFDKTETRIYKKFNKLLDHVLKKWL